MNPASVPHETTHSSFSITTDALSKRYNREWIFRRLDYTFQAGNTYAITGPNGSGKSTLLQVLWGQVPPTSGALRYYRAPSDIPTEHFYRHIAIATPYMDLIEEYTMREMLSFHFKLRAIRPGVRLDDLAAIMYLEDALDKQLVNFSSGMRQRLKLALAFYSSADVYFFDEPGTNLDARAFNWYRAQLAHLPPEALVMIASNNPEEYPETATSIQMMDFKK